MSEKNGMALTFHSYKGGTGKTSLSVNVAAQMALNGKNVVIADFDLRAPSLFSIFPQVPRNYVNDFLNGECTFDDVLMEIGNDILPSSSEGHLRVALANPDSGAIQHMQYQGRKYQYQALQRILKMKRDLLINQDVDVLIFDTSPGINYSALNVLSVSDAIILVSRTDENDIEGTRQLVLGTYSQMAKFGTFPLLVINRSIVGTDQEVIRIGKMFATEFDIPLLQAVACYCEIASEGGRSLQVAKKPNHGFTTSIRELVAEIEKRVG
jgi:MinD-like ATPase involved in chromosome partitioning or flagellar assembly